MNKYETMGCDANIKMSKLSYGVIVWGFGYKNNHLNSIVGTSQFISSKCKKPQLKVSLGKCRMQQQLGSWVRRRLGIR